MMSGQEGKDRTKIVIHTVLLPCSHKGGKLLTRTVNLPAFSIFPRDCDDA